MRRFSIVTVIGKCKTTTYPADTREEAIRKAECFTRRRIRLVTVWETLPPGPDAKPGHHGGNVRIFSSIAGRTLAF